MASVPATGAPAGREVGVRKGAKVSRIIEHIDPEPTKGRLLASAMFT